MDLRGPRVRAKLWQPFARRRIARPSIVSSSSFHWLKLDRQVFHFWLHDVLVIAVAHFYRVSVCASFEYDVVLFGQMLVDVSRQTVKVPKRRHRPNRGVWKQ